MATGNQSYLNMAIFKMYLLSYEIFAIFRQVGLFAIEMIDIVYLKSYYNCQDKYADMLEGTNVLIGLVCLKCMATTMFRNFVHQIACRDSKDMKFEMTLYSLFSSHQIFRQSNCPMKT